MISKKKKKSGSSNPSFSGKQKSNQLKLVSALSDIPFADALTWPSGELDAVLFGASSEGNTVKNQKSFERL